MPRRKTGTAWLIRVPDDLAEQIDRRATRAGLSRAEIVRRMLRWANKKSEFSMKEYDNER